MAKITLTPEMIELFIAEEKKKLQAKFDEDVAALEAKYATVEMKFKAVPNKYSDEDKKTIIKMYKAGSRAKDISEALDRKPSSVNAYISKLKKEGKIE